jgi:hypothetical protein
MTVVCSFWVFWGVAEMFYEGWWGSWGLRLAYLIPGAVTFLLLLLCVFRPRAGGVLLILVGAGFTVWWWWQSIANGTITWAQVLAQFPLSGIMVLIGWMFLYEARYRKAAPETSPDTPWWKSHLRVLIAVGFPVVVALVVLAINLPMVINRLDDGDRGARLIHGNNGVVLIWAPQGPGWNWQQESGGYPSWNSLALYGLEPIGLKTGLEQHATQEDMTATSICSYLSEDGLTLMDEPQYIWRMPTAFEIISSLTLGNQNAGCVWEDVSTNPICVLTPDKETPLWAPDEAPIYYWAGDEYSEDRAYYVSFNGKVNNQPKGWGNPRHGYRCVKEP